MVMSVANCISAISAADFTIRHPRTTGAPLTMVTPGIAFSSPSTAKYRTVSSTPTRPLARSEEHTSELQSLMRISYAVFCLKKKKTTSTNHQQQYRLQHRYNNYQSQITTLYKD